MEELRNLGLPPETAFLPMEGQGRAQKALKEQWLKTDLGKEIVEEVDACLMLVNTRIVSVSLIDLSISSLHEIH